MTDKAKYLICLLGLLVAIPGCISTVATGEVGIKTTWGKITGTNLKEGVQVKAPFRLYQGHPLRSYRSLRVVS